MELRHLRYFVAVAEELHFGRAAQRLYMAQPPLSQQIRQLEREIGVTLLARNNRNVALTAAGQAFLADARAILARVEEATIHAQRVSRGEAGWLGIGFVGSAMYDLLPAVLREFRGRCPDVELELLELLGGQQEEALRDGRIHVGFARLTGDADGLIRETIVREPLIVALPAEHPLAAARKAIPLASLAGEPFILYPQQSSYADTILRLCNDAGFDPTVVQKTGEVQTAVGLVAAGIGVTLVPAAVQNLRREGVVYRAVIEPIPGIEMTMTYRSGEKSAILSGFLETVREAVRNRPNPETSVLIETIDSARISGKI
jgi:DNA-binding transcriptional LysR family regulator